MFAYSCSPEIRHVDGIAWLLGLLQGGLALNGYDAVAHMWVKLALFSYLVGF